MSLMTCNVLSLVTKDDNNFGRLRLISLTPGSPAECHLAHKNVLGFHILTINGVRIRTVTDIRMILHDYQEPDWKRGPAYLMGVTILFGVAAINSPEPDQIEFSEQDHATARVVWSILGSSALKQPTIEPQCAVAIDPSSHHGHDNHATTAISAIEPLYMTGGGIDLQQAQYEMDKALCPPPDDETIAYVHSILTSSLHIHTDIPHHDIKTFVQSIMASDRQPSCPKFWHHAMKDPVNKGKWIKAMFKHLDSCYAVGNMAH